VLARDGVTWLMPTAITVSVGLAVSPWALFAVTVLWFLPDWIHKWLDLRDRR
jgi:hypothetical protein